MWSNVQFYIIGLDVSDSCPGTYPYAAFNRKTLTKSQDWVVGGFIHHAAVGALEEDATVTNVDQLFCRQPRRLGRRVTRVRPQR